MNLKGPSQKETKRLFVIKSAGNKGRIKFYKQRIPLPDTNTTLQKTTLDSEDTNVLLIRSNLPVNKHRVRILLLVYPLFGYF